MQNGESPNAGWRKIGAVTGFTGEVTALVLAATFGGGKADEYFGSSPWLLLLSVILATSAIFLLIWRMRRWFL